VGKRIEQPAARPAADPDRAARISLAIAQLRADGQAARASGVPEDPFGTK
jgi:hypothetical protein